VPELIEVECYRRAAEAGLLGAPVAEVAAPDGWFVKGPFGPEALAAALEGATFTAARRHGKLLVLDTDAGRRLGLRFGMTGRLVVGGVAVIDRLLYSSGRDEPAWDRFALRLVDGRSARVQDPRRLGGVELDPDESALGPDAATIRAPALRAALGGSAAPLKARLMDQSRLAGLGNLLTDEVLWQARLRPGRPAGSLADGETASLARTIVRTVSRLQARGGSHMGRLQPQRRRDGRCPRCRGPLRAEPVGGRTTYWCPTCQR
jgi:formamidopyrimidine-DNA glycosylase